MTSLTDSRYPLMTPASEPLRKRVPALDEQGKPLSDFMMLFPRLRDQPRHQVERTLIAIQGVLANFESNVVFAELNLKLNLLWVSIRPVQGLRLEIADAIQNLVPGAKLVSHI
ncbi:MAG TPA: hypothetical protein VLA26_07410 [Gammaproteobacteria bacterium]|nr:hypothetical protein [Gammaproteobacteria bacterium]